MIPTSLPFCINTSSIKSPILAPFSTQEGVLDDNYDRGRLANSDYVLGGEEDFKVNA